MRFLMANDMHMTCNLVHIGSQVVHFFINHKFWKDYDSILKILDCEIDFNSGQLVLEIQH